MPGLLVVRRNAVGRASGCQYRPDLPRDGGNGKPVKYETPKNQRNGLHVPPGVGDNLKDRTIPLVVTEGIKKADCAAAKQICAIGIFGVYGWRGTDCEGNKTALGDWDSVSLDGRLVVVAFDSDIRTNPRVRKAALRLGEFLGSRSAVVRYWHPPDEWWRPESKVGLDDFLVTGNTFEDLMSHAETRPPLSDTDDDDEDPTQPNEAEILSAIKRQNTFDEARRRRLAATWEEPEDQGTLEHQLQTAEAPPVKLVEDIFPDRTICQLNAQFKCGKTTLEG